MVEKSQHRQHIAQPKTATELEPGLLSVFRMILAVMGSLQLLSILTYVFAVQYRRSPLHTAAPAWIFLSAAIGIFALLLYLYSDHIRQQLGRAFLPVAIIVYTFGAIIHRYVLLYYLFYWSDLTQLMDRTRPNFTVQDSAWSMLLSLMVPLVMVAWQYEFKRVLSYTFLTFLFETPLLFLLYTAQMGPVEDAWLFAGIVRTVIFLAVGYILTQMIGAQRQQRQELALANSKLREHAATLEQLTISRERNQMARELHDTLAHSLSAVSVQLEAIDSVFESSPAEARYLLGKALAQTRSGLAETRRALQSLRASPLEDLGLKLALETVAHSVAKRGGMSLQLRMDDVGELPAECEQNIYRIAQEAMTNALTHAQAQTLSVSLHRQNGTVVLAVSDDGVGFDSSQFSQLDRFGLRGIQERADLIDGKIEIESMPGKGTTVQLRVPTADDKVTG